MTVTSERPVHQVAGGVCRSLFFFSFSVILGCSFHTGTTERHVVSIDCGSPQQRSMGKDG